MSRIGKMPVEIPQGVEVKINGTHVTAKGPKGTLEQDFHKDININMDDNTLVVTRNNNQKTSRSLHGLTRSLLSNMVVGVSAGFTKELEINGVGYRAAKQGKKLVLTVGYSHPVEMEEIDGISIDVPSPNKVIILGPDKQKVGQFAAEVRKKRPPEPYKGKGIKYVDEVIVRKEGKAAKGSA